MQSPTPQTPQQKFGIYYSQKARSAGYDIDNPRGGGRAALARATGLAESTIGRILSGKTMPSPKTLDLLAKAVRTPVRELLVEAGIIPSESVSESHPSQVGSHPPTPEDAADAWDIRDPLLREMFLGAVERIQRLQREKNQKTSAADDEDSGGGVAAQN